MDADPSFVGEGDIEAARALVAEANDAELFLYPGDAHLFADNSLPDYDEDAAELLIERTLSFLDKRGPASCRSRRASALTSYPRLVRRQGLLALVRSVTYRRFSFQSAFDDKQVYGLVQGHRQTHKCMECVWENLTSVAFLSAPCKCER